MAVLESGWVAIVSGVDTGADVEDKLDVAFANVDTFMTEILAPQVSQKFEPQNACPSHVEGQMYYCNVEKSIGIQTDIDEFHVHIGTDIVIRVINKTGSPIPAMTAVRNGGIDATSGEIKALLAQSNELTSAFVIGITPKAIANDAEGWIVANGKMHNLDTSLLAVGGTLFLSDVDAGGLIQTIPDVASALGTVLVSNDTVGEIFVKIDNLITYPQVTGIFRGQNTPLYEVTTAAQDIVGYTDEVDIILEADSSLGTFTLPLNGHYQITFTSIPTFISSTSTRTLYFELYNETLSTVIGAYPRNIPRDATEEGMSFTAPIVNGTAGHVYKMRVRASLSVDVTFSNMAFMLTSHFLG